jgi:hypothetical protein
VPRTFGRERLEISGISGSAARTIPAGGLRAVRVVPSNPVTVSGFFPSASSEAALHHQNLYAPGLPTQRRPHWYVTVLVPSALFTIVDVMGCEPFFRQ